MKIKKVLNNNIVIALDQRERECVIIGKGIAFQKKVGQDIDVTGAEKIYKPTGKGAVEKLSSIIEDIPFDHIKVSDEIINMAKRELGDLDENIYLTLIDHISFSIRRYNKGMEFHDMFWEVKSMYPDEYQVGLKSLEIVRKRLNINLPESEASLIAFHMLNAKGTNTTVAKQSVRLIQGILEIVSSHFEVCLDESSVQYARFIRHLKFFSRRLFGSDSKIAHGKDNKLLLKLLQDNLEERTCVDKIAEFVRKEFGQNISWNERSYLVIHINSVIQATRE